MRDDILFSHAGMHVFTRSGAQLTGSVPPHPMWDPALTPAGLIANNADLFDVGATHSDHTSDATYNGIVIGGSSSFKSIELSNITEDLLVFATVPSTSILKPFALTATYSNASSSTGDNIAVGQLQLTREGTGATIEVEGTNLDKIGLASTNTVIDYHKTLSDITATDNDTNMYNHFSAIQDSISIVESAISQLDKNRANIGSTYNQLSSTLNNISTAYINLKSSESVIRDVDFAEESEVFSKSSILAQAGNFAQSQLLKYTNDNITNLLK